MVVIIITTIETIYISLSRIIENLRLQLKLKYGIINDMH